MVTGCLTDHCSQTSSATRDVCPCGHAEAFHRLPPTPDITNDQLSPVSPPPTNMQSFSSFPNHIPPSTGSHLIPPPRVPMASRPVPAGVPVNTSLPILREFHHPLQHQRTSTSEENRQWSIARMNSLPAKPVGSLKPAGRRSKQTIRTPTPVRIMTKLAILLFPVKVCRSNYSHPLILLIYPSGIWRTPSLN